MLWGVVLYLCGGVAIAWAGGSQVQPGKVATPKGAPQAAVPARLPALPQALAAGQHAPVDAHENLGQSRVRRILAALVAPLTRARNAGMDPATAIGRMIDGGRLDDAAQALDTYARASETPEQEAVGAVLNVRLQEAKARLYETKGGKSQSKLAYEAAEHARRGTLAGVLTHATRHSRNGECLYCAVENAVSSMGREDLAAKSWEVHNFRGDRVLVDPGVSDANVRALLDHLGLPSQTLLRDKIPRDPTPLARRLLEGHPILASLSMVVERPSGIGEWRHIVHLESMFYSRSQRSWVVGVRDSEKGRVEYYVWNDFRVLASSLHLIGPPEVGSRAVPSPSDPKGSAREDRFAAIAAIAPRQFSHVFIQQEHEGNLDLRSSGDVFSYYEPTQWRPLLLSETVSALDKMERVGYWLARALRPWDRSAQAGWRALSRSGKADYLRRLEHAVTVEAGDSAVWKEREFLLLKRRADAPVYLAEFAQMSVPPGSNATSPRGIFNYPEIVTAETAPARTIAEAVGRSERIIADTGHAGVHFHVFVDLEPGRLQANLESLLTALQIANNVLYLDSAMTAPDNMLHDALLPWHEGRSRRVREIASGAGSHRSKSRWIDPDGEKRVHLAWRYWGIGADGRMRISLELRGTPLDKAPRRSTTFDAFNGDEPAWDYSRVKTHLAFLVMEADALANRRLPTPAAAAPIVLNQAEAERTIAARAQARGLSVNEYDNLAQFAFALGGRRDDTHPSYLLPFAVQSAGEREIGGAFDAFVDEFLDISKRFKHYRATSATPNQIGQFRFEYWNAYKRWASAYQAIEMRRFERLFDRLRSGETAH